MERLELTFQISGSYTDYQVQQLISERIFALQGTQNQVYQLRMLRLIGEQTWEVVLVAPIPRNAPSHPLAQEEPEEQTGQMDDLRLYEGPDDDF